MIIIDILIAIVAVSIALALLYITCIMIAFVSHKFCNMIMLVAQTIARSIISMFLSKMGKKYHYGCYNTVHTE